MIKMQPSFGLCAVLLALSVVSVLGGENDVVVLTDSDFDSEVSQHEAILVMFFAPWCGHCKRLKPDFEKAAEILKGNDPPIALGKVDCTEGGKDTCGKYGVSGYPTLKIFKNGEFASEYNGPRESGGIVKYMKAQVGPAARELKDLKETDKFLDNFDVGIVGFFSSASSSLKKTFEKVADRLRETVRFGFSVTDSINEKHHADKIVMYRPKRLKSMFEDSSVVYDGSEDTWKIEDWIKKNYHGLAGHRTADNSKDFKNPLVVAYYEVDYKKNVKGTNYWRNRFMKVAQAFKDKASFAISAKDEFQHELNEYGLDYVAGDKPAICARDSEGKKFVMSGEFSMESFEKFLQDFTAGKLEPYLKSEPIPEDSGPVVVAVAKNFDEVVTNSGKDCLIEFYAPWCGHCKKLAPVYEELAEKLKDENVNIVKMDATANDVPGSYDVRGFPTLYWKPKNEDKAKRYEGGRELDDFLKYIAKHATDELNGFDRKGKAKKTEL